MTGRRSSARAVQVMLCAAGLLTAFLWSSAAMGQTVVFDHGPTTGTPVASCWSNSTAYQNFADQATLPSATEITAVVDFTCDAPVGTVHVKILSDNGSGAPGSVLYAEDKTPDASIADAASGGYKVTVNLTTPFSAQAGVTYWYGVSGNGSNPDQLSILSPGDGQMAQFDGATYQFSASVGDQMFQLLGQPVEAIPTLDRWGLLAFALLMAAAGFAAIRRLA